MKKLGIPRTLGEFRKLTNDYPDETLLEFRNEPIHELLDMDGELVFNAIYKVPDGTILIAISANTAPSEVNKIIEEKQYLPIALPDLLSVHPKNGEEP